MRAFQNVASSPVTIQTVCSVGETGGAVLCICLEAIDRDQAVEVVQEQAMPLNGIKDDAGFQEQRTEHVLELLRVRHKAFVENCLLHGKTKDKITTHRVFG